MTKTKSEAHAQQFPESVTAAMARLQTILDKREAHRAAIQRTAEEIASAENMAKAAKAELGELGARNALNGSADSVMNSKPARDLKEARERTEILEEQLSVLKRREPETNAELQTANEAFKAAAGQFAESKIAEFEELYVTAAHEFSRVVNRGRALAEAFNVRLEGIEQTRILTARLDQELVPKETAIAGNGHFSYQPAWRHDPGAMTVHETLSPIALLRNRADSELVEVRRYQTDRQSFLDRQGQIEQDKSDAAKFGTHSVSRGRDAVA